MITKDELRKNAIHTRNSLDMDEISNKIVKKILSNNIYQESKNIMIFYPLKGEINLLPLLEDKKSADKIFYLPRVKGKEMEVCKYSQGDELKISAFKTKEPTSESLDTNMLDLIFVPALMVDRNFNRIGYGKGFYDRFLSKNAKRAIKIVPIPSMLITKEIPTDCFDTKFDAIIDES